jgi:hypothetical protein
MDKIESVRNDIIWENTSDMTFITYTMKVTEVYKVNINNKHLNKAKKQNTLNQD